MKSRASYLPFLPSALTIVIVLMEVGLVAPGFARASETNSAVTNAVSAARMTVPLSMLPTSGSSINKDAMRQRLVPRSYTLEDDGGVARYLFRDPKLFKFWQVLNPFAPRSMGTPPGKGMSFGESRPMSRVFADDKTREAGGISVMRFSW